MSLIAIDIALLLPKDITEWVVTLNNTGNPTSVLNTTTNLPHITVFMGLIHREHIPQIKEKIAQAIKEIPLPVELTISDIQQTTRPNGDSSYSLEILPNKQLQYLHEYFMEKVTPLCGKEQVTVDMFNQDDPVQEISTYWVQQYHKTHANSQKYSPHISLKCTNPQNNKPFPISFCAETFVLSHLGDQCTVREIL